MFQLRFDPQTCVFEVALCGMINFPGIFVVALKLHWQLSHFFFFFFFAQAVCLFHCLIKKSGADCHWRPIPLRVKPSLDTTTETCWASLQPSIHPVNLRATEHRHWSKTLLSLYLTSSFQRKCHAVFNRRRERSTINESSTSGSEKSVEPASHPTTSAKQSVATYFTCFNRKRICTYTSPTEAHLRLVPYQSISVV